MIQLVKYPVQLKLAKSTISSAQVKTPRHLR